MCSSSVLPIKPVGSIWIQYEMRQWRKSTPVAPITLEPICIWIITLFSHVQSVYTMPATNSLQRIEAVHLNTRSMFECIHLKTVTETFNNTLIGGGFHLLSIHSLQTRKRPSLTLLQDAFHFKEVSWELFARNTPVSRLYCIPSLFRYVSLLLYWRNRWRRQAEAESSVSPWMIVNL